MMHPCSQRTPNPNNLPYAGCVLLASLRPHLTAGETKANKQASTCQLRPCTGRDELAPVALTTPSFRSIPVVAVFAKGSSTQPVRVQWFGPVLSAGYHLN